MASEKSGSVNRADRSLAWIAMGTVGLVACTGAAAQAASAPAVAEVPAGTGTAQHVQQEAPILQFDIPAGTWAEAAVAFENATGLELSLKRDGIAELPFAGLRGEFTIEQALQRMLESTGLSHRYISPKVIVLEIRPLTTAVDVTTAAPGSTR